MYDSDGGGELEVQEFTSVLVDVSGEGHGAAAG
jgi:hypothetical protein